MPASLYILKAHYFFNSSKLWEDVKDPDTLTGILFLRDGDQFFGRVNMQKIDEEVPELGIDLLKEYQNQGYGPEAIAAFANWYGRNLHISEIKVRITSANARSAHIFLKLGGAVHTGGFVLFERSKALGGVPAGKTRNHYAGPERAGIYPQISNLIFLRG